MQCEDNVFTAGTLPRQDSMIVVYRNWMWRGLGHQSKAVHFTYIQEASQGKSQKNLKPAFEKCTFSEHKIRPTEKEAT